MVWFTFPYAWIWIITFFVYTANFWAVIYVSYHKSEVHYDYVKEWANLIQQIHNLIFSFFQQTYNINVYNVKVIIHRYYVRVLKNFFIFMISWSDNFS